MKNFALLLLLLPFLACESGGIMSKKFTYELYESLDYEKLLKSDKIDDNELFLLNYAVIRQRDYFNYTIENKPFQEILEMAGQFSRDGFPVEVKLNDNGKQDQIRQTVAFEGVGMVRKKSNQKRLLKTVNFKCKYENTSDQSVVLLNSSFVVKGPFNDYLTTVNYEINCILGAGESVYVGFIVPGKTIQRNLLFEGNPRIRRLGIDNILNQIKIEPSGMSLQDKGKYFKECFFNDARLEPQVIIDFAKNLKENWKTQGADGTYTIDLGDMHIPDTSDEVIQMR